MNCSQISLMVSTLSIFGRIFNKSSKTSSTLIWLDCLSNVGYHSLRWMRVSKGTSTGVISSWDGTECNQLHCYLRGCSMYKNNTNTSEIPTWAFARKHIFTRENNVISYVKITCCFHKSQDCHCYSNRISKKNTQMCCCVIETSSFPPRKSSEIFGNLQ